MNDIEIYKEVAELMQSDLEIEEQQIAHTKFLGRRIAGLETLLLGVIRLLSHPGGAARHEDWASLEAVYDAKGLQDDLRTLVATQESRHEKRGHLLAQFQKKLEAE